MNGELSGDIAYRLFISGDLDPLHLIDNIRRLCPKEASRFDDVQLIALYRLFAQSNPTQKDDVGFRLWLANIPI